MAPRPDRAPARPRRRKGDHSLYWKASRGLWVVRIDRGIGPDGKRDRWEATAKTESAARAKLTKALRELDTNGVIGDRRTTVAAWLTTWLATIVRPNARPATYVDYERCVRLHLAPRIGRHPIGKLTPAHVRAAEDDIATTLTPATARSAHRVLSVALTAAVREGLVGRNVAAAVTPPKSTPATRDALTADDARALLAYATIHDPDRADLWAAALLQGARRGEAVGLEWDRVDLDAETVDLCWQLRRLPFEHGCQRDQPAKGIAGACGRSRPGSCPRKRLAVPHGYEHRVVDGGLCLVRPKTSGSVRLLPLAPTLAGMLRARREAMVTAGRIPAGFVWTRAMDDARPFDPDDVTAAWSDLVTSAGVPVVDLHSARHTTATLLLELGVPERVVQEILGHTVAATTQVYQHVDLALARAALARLNDAVA